MNKLQYYKNQVLPDVYNIERTPFADKADLLYKLKRAKRDKETIYAFCYSGDNKTGETEFIFLDNVDVIGYMQREDVSYENTHIGRAIACVDSIVGVKIIDIEDEIDGLIRVRCSRKEVMQEIHDKYNEDVKNEILKEGLLLKGVITGMDLSKVYVDIGGDVTAILGVADISRAYVRQPSDILQSGDKIELAIKKAYPLDEEKPMHISLSRSMLLNGWENIDRRFQKGKIVPGIIKNRMATGIFIELSESFEGIAENIPQGVRYNYGDRVKVNILNIDTKRQKIKLRIIENR